MRDTLVLALVIVSFMIMTSAQAQYDIWRYEETIDPFTDEFDFSFVLALANNNEGAFSI